jgi:hypothetical protein
MEFKEVPNNNVRGICSVCGAKAYHPRAMKCNDHREDGKVTGSGSLTETVKRTNEGKGNTGPGPAASKWNSVTQKFIIILTSLLATLIVHNANIIDPSNELEDAMTATNDEALAMAKPFARMLSNTQFSKKHGHAIVDNEDAIDAAIAAYEYAKRLMETQRTIRDVVNNRERATQQAPPMRQTPPRSAPQPPTTEGNEPDGTNGQTEEFGPPRGVYANPQPWQYSA